MRKPKPPSTIDPPPLPTRTLGSSALNSMMQGIRDRVSHQRFEIGKTIAELDAWRDEIDATIAFLKAQRGEQK